VAKSNHQIKLSLSKSLIHALTSIHTEVEILVASNPVSTECISILTCFILHLFKITTEKMRSFDDVHLFSIKLDILKITRKDNSFDIYLSHSYAPAQLTPLV